MDYFATAIPGFGFALQRELGERHFSLRGPGGFDGRNDVVPFRDGHDSPVLDLRTCEDVFAEVAQVKSRGPLRALVAKLASRPIEEVLQVHRRARGSRTRAVTFRVVVRVRSEENFRRTDARDALTFAIARRRTRWRVNDPASLEFWLLEVEPGLFRFGLRLSTQAMRARGGGRRVERPGALRPSAAAAMCLLAGKPSGTLLDPLCGAGTILAEARALGWRPVGGDIDPRAVEIARANLNGHAAIERWDARRLPLVADSQNAVVSNLPFGKRFGVQGNPRTWALDVLRELDRVAAGGAPLVLLAPERLLAGAAKESPLRIEGLHRVQLLGEQSVVWQLRAS
jgi:tRNA G10  N-methylase Trm11